MTKEEVLEEAKRIYTIGTEFTPAHTASSSDIVKIEEGDYIDWMKDAIEYLLDEAHWPEVLLHEKPVIQAFVEYYRRQWNPKLEKLCLFKILRPRTTNYAEGWNRALSYLFRFVFLILFHFSFLLFQHNSLSCDERIT